MSHWPNAHSSPFVWLTAVCSLACARFWALLSRRPGSQPPPPPDNTRVHDKWKPEGEEVERAQCGVRGGHACNVCAQYSLTISQHSYPPAVATGAKCPRNPSAGMTHPLCSKQSSAQQAKTLACNMQDGQHQTVKQSCTLQKISTQQITAKTKPKTALLHVHLASPH